MSQKRRKREPWIFSIFLKILVTFALITVPILLASFWLNKRAEQITKQQIFSLTWEQMEGNLEKFDEQIATLTGLLQYMCSNLDEIETISNMPEALTMLERAKVVKSINKQFVQIKLVNHFVEDVRIHLRLLECTISTSSINVPMDFSEYEFIMNTPLSFNTLSFYEGKLILFATSAANMNYKPGVKDASFFLVAELSQKEIMEYMVQGNYAEDSASILINEDQSYQLCSEAKEEDFVRNQILSNVAQNPDFEQDLMKIDGIEYLVLKKKSEQTGLYLIKYIRFEENFPIFSIYGNWLLVFVFLVAIAVSLFAFLIYRMIKKPINQLTEAFRRVEEGDFTVSVTYEKKDEFQYLYHRFDRMVENTRNLIEQVYEQQILSQRAELKQLQSQINPHFLYNSLFIISVMARQGEMEFVENFTEQLGQYFHFIIKNEKETIALSEEISYAKLYAEIQMTRFSNRIMIEIEEVPERYRDYQVPRLMIQPLIENSLSHGLEKKSAGGKLVLSFEERDHDIVILYIEDNGENVTEQLVERMNALLKGKTKEAQVSGIFNIHRRLQIQFGGESGLSFYKRLEGGLKVRLLLDFGGKHV